MDPYVKSVRALDDYELEVSFDNGERRIFDVKPYLSRGIFVRLQNRSLFQAVREVSGSIEWPGGLDLSYETLYVKSSPLPSDVSAQIEYLSAEKSVSGTSDETGNWSARKSLEECPSPLPSDIQQLLNDLAVLWARHEIRPRIDPDDAAYWNDLILAWSNEVDLPLLIRKKERGLTHGEPVIHDSGRELVLTDNSPAWWTYHRAFCGERPSLAEIRRFLESDKVPVAMIVDREMSVRSRYKCQGTAETSPNSLGWRVCHKRNVRLRGRGSIRHRSLVDLQAHFRDFLSPSNMFLVPKTLGGLGELPHVIEAIRRAPNGL